LCKFCSLIILNPGFGLRVLKILHHIKPIQEQGRKEKGNDNS